MSKRKLLLADDSITIQKVVNLTFADEGIEVISVGDGDSAMRKFDEFMPDLVMADVNMPGLNGYEVCRIIKLTEETQDIPVILLVGSFEPFDEEEAKKAGADDFLTKPFQSISQLVNKVTDLLNQRERGPEASADEMPPEPVGDTFAETLEFEKMPVSLSDYESPREESMTGFEGRREEIGSEFGDAGMDDEMIETSPANEYLSDDRSETSIDFEQTLPLNEEELKGYNIVSGTIAEQESPQPAEDREGATETWTDEPERAEAASFEEEARKLGVFPAYQETEKTSEVVSETEPEIDYYLPEGDEESAPAEEFEKELTDAETLAPEISYENEPPRTPDFSQASADETAEPAGEGTLETAETEEAAETLNASFEDAQAAQTFEEPAAEKETFDGTEAVREMESDYNARSETEAASEAAEDSSVSQNVDETPVSEPAKTASFAGFDDGDLLELPPLVEETGIRPSPKIEPAAAVEPEAAETAAEPVAEAAEPQTGSGESNIMQSFPPELIEAIAQRVAEKISAKTMNDVLPQITELVMKKMAEENRKNEN